MTKKDLSKQEKMNFDSYSTDYQLKLYETAKLTEPEQELFGAYLRNKKYHILDIGCGGGRTTTHLSKMGHEVIGVDVVPGMIELAKKDYPDIDFQVMSVNDLKFSDAEFDVVIFSFNGLDCVYPETKRWEAFTEMLRVLKPGGLMILSSHNSIIWPTNRYIWFWWFFNIVTGKIFTAFRYEFKSFRQKSKFIYFARRPSRQLKDFLKRGVELLEIFPNYQFAWTKKLMKEKRANIWLDLFSPYPYFVFRKNDSNKKNN